MLTPPEMLSISHLDSEFTKCIFLPLGPYKYSVDEHFKVPVDSNVLLSKMLLSHVAAVPRHASY